MSSSIPPPTEDEAIPLDDASKNPADGGTSNHWTQGEIVFLTLMSFVALLAIVIGAYAYCRQRQNKNQPIHENEVAKLRRRTETDADFEAVGAMDYPGGNDENTIVITQMDALRRQGSVGRLRSSSTGSNGSNKKGRRRSTIESVENEGRNLRRASTAGSELSSVSKNYKLAAIDHMNHISQSGRHDI